MRVHAIGYYGMGNFGDDLFRQVVSNEIGFLWPEGTQVKAWAPRRPGIYSRNGVLGKGLRLGAAAFGASWATNLALCGGSVLHDIEGVQALRARLAASRWIEALGVSIGPFESEEAKKAVVRYLDGASRVVVRDAQSQVRAGRDFPVGGDLAALATGIRRSGVGGHVTICPSHAASVPVEDICRLLVSAVPKTTPLVLMSLNYHPVLGDEAETAHLAGLLVDEGFDSVKMESYRDLDLTGVCEVLAASRWVLAYRLHAAIVAYLSGVPFMVFAHHVKLLDFAMDIGLDSRLIMEDLDSQFAGAVELVERVLSPWAMPPEEYRDRAIRTYRWRE